VRATEVGWLSLLTIIALLLRSVHLARSSVSHFDEGVYLLWGLAGDYPAKELFAPPLFPKLAGAASLIVGPGDFSGQLLNAVIGAATVPAVWWVSRCWYSSTASVVSASLATFSGFHIAFSRLVLTDVLFTFWFVLSLAVIAESLFRDCISGEFAASESTAGRDTIDTRHRLITAAAGLAAGAAMNTKYNGVLVLMIPGLALVLGYALGLVRTTALWRRALPRLVLIATIAALLYLPWFWHVHSAYGYTALLQHHSGYSTGIRQWPQNLVTMLASEQFLNGGRGFVGPLAGLSIGLTFHARSPGLKHVGLLACVSVAGICLGDGVGWILASIVMLFNLRNGGATNLVLLCWLGSLILLTPLYRPYARLMLPLLAAGWVAYGAAIDLLLRRLEGGRAGGVREPLGVNEPRLKGVSSSRSPRDKGWIRFGRTAAGFVCVAGAGFIYWKHTRANRDWSSNTTLKVACEKLVRSIPEPDRIASYVRPPALFYLYEFAGARAAGLRDPSVPDALQRWLVDPAAPHWLIVDQSLLPDNASLRDQIEQARDGLHEVARFSYRPSDAVLLDDFGRVCLSPDFESIVDRNYQLVLYQRGGADQGSGFGVQGSEASSSPTGHLGW
jgi:hypothetical protein